MDKSISNYQIHFIKAFGYPELVGKTIIATDEFVYEYNGKLKLYDAFEGELIERR
jgi:hypothetical protein